MTVTTGGLVCAHHHLYSALARGMPPPPATPRSFPEVLEQVWWRLDRALDLDLVRWSALLGAVEALEAGTTAIVDHHASPAAIDGSLDVILVERPQPRSPSGIKGVGEIGLVPTAGAVAGALHDLDGEWRATLPMRRDGT